jgi:RNA polymerase sigma-70 factor (ECF subfamily)
MALQPHEAAQAAPACDRDLLLCYHRRQDMDAFTTILDRHQADLLRTAHAILGDAEAAQDAVQESFIALTREAGRLSGRLRGEGLGGWLTTVVRNRCIDELRRRQSQRLTELPPDAPAPTSIQQDTESPTGIWDAVEQLPALERSAVLLRYRDELSYQDIATRMGKTVSHVGVLLHQAMQRLRAHPALHAEAAS